MLTNQRLIRQNHFKTAILSCLISLFFSLLILHSPVSGAVSDTQPPARKSPAKAVRLSLLSTAVPAVAGGTALLLGLQSDNDNNMLAIVGGVTGVFGLIVGPSVGHNYAESKGGTGLVLRAGTTLLGSIVTIYALTTQSITLDASQDKTSPSGVVLGTTLLGISAISAVHDIVSSGNAARRYNQTHGFTTVQLTPTYFALSNAPGLALRIGF